LGCDIVENVSDMVLSDDVPDNPPADCKNCSQSYAPSAVQGFAELAFARNDAHNAQHKQENIWRYDI
jgi:hypothetical protein